jgi:hypothetical protein
MFEFLRVYTPSRPAQVTRCGELLADTPRFETWREKNAKTLDGLVEGPLITETTTDR